VRLQQIIINRGGLRQEKLRFRFGRHESLSRLQQDREQALDLTGSTSREQPNHGARLMHPKLRPKRGSIILRRHRIEQRMTDERTPDSCPAIQFSLERENHDDMIDAPLNPLHPTRSPGPDLRRNIIEHPAACSFGHPCEMKI
jgi:hypothetical protein